MNIEQFILSTYDCSETSTQGQYRITCPFCHHRNRKFYFYIYFGYYKCYHCDARGRIAYLVKKFHPTVTLSDLDFSLSYIERENTEIIPLPRNFRSFNRPSASPVYVEAYLYSINRNISEKVIKSFNLGYSPSFTNQIIIPIYDATGRQVYFTTRYYKNAPDGLKYFNPFVKNRNTIGKGDVVFNIHRAVHYPEVFLCEGPYDALSIASYKYNAVSILGKKITAQQLKILKQSQFTRITVCLDGDAEKESYELAQALQNATSSDIYICKFSGNKDPNTALVDNTLHRFLNTARPFTKMTRIIGISEKFRNI